MEKQIVNSVCGPIDPKSLGFTLTHEHFSLDFEKFYASPPVGVEDYIDDKITLNNVGYVRQYPYSSRFNINFQDDETHQAVLKDVTNFKHSGGGTIVENTSHGLNRNLELMYQISKKCNINVIAGTGHYVQAVQTGSVINSTIEELTDLYTKEILFGVPVVGCDDHGGLIKCGIIGEVGSSWPITTFEKKAIQATAETQSILKCPVSFHPGRDKKAPFEIIRLYLEAGGNADKCVMSHLDRTLLHDEDLQEFANLGTYCQFDLFGTECSYYQLNPTSYMQSDEQRLNHILELINAGCSDKILISHDIHTKHRLIEFGGHGYAHILNNILMRFSLKGVDLNTIDDITIKNPAKWLQMEA
ncbi:phosphotriesterase-related protein [Culex pipiens pallens]|uniref:Phosphotriesterase-related protein n=1 Tax=Culex pipiens TaxID=7175 RepID=A0A8D8CAW3_CULPI|nr:phosphotriesterase-related protein [Culex pipiens pallens]XP_052564124.1 phosphotriesterase-related protein [Culex pipiens pallens]